MAENKSVTRVTAYQRVFRSPEGEIVLTDLLKRYGGLQSTYDDDPYRHAFQEGQRAVVLEIMKDLRMNVNELLKRLQEGYGG